MKSTSPGGPADGHRGPRERDRATTGEDVLLPQMGGPTGIVASITDPVGMVMEPGLVTYAVTRDIGGETQIFLVDFVRGANGVWCLDEM
jgi:hypothetical protein